jgi:hypothetical protein
MTTRRCFRCRCCGVVLPAWLPGLGRPDDAMRLGHMTQAHPAELRPFLDQDVSDDIAPVIMQAFEASRVP